MAWSCMPHAPWLWVILSRRPEGSREWRCNEDFMFATEPARVAGIDTLAGHGRSKSGGARGGSTGLARWLAGAVVSGSGFHAAVVARSPCTQPAFPRDQG